MTEAASGRALILSAGARARLRRRHAAERRFRWYGLAAILVAIAMLALLLVSIVVKGHSAFLQTEIGLDIHFDAELIDPGGTGAADDISRADFAALVRVALMRRFADVTARRDVRRLLGVVSRGASFDLRAMVLEDSTLIGTTRRVWVPAADQVDMLRKGRVDRDIVEADRGMTDREIAWIDALDADGLVRSVFNWRFLASGDSREPELAGVGGAMIGSFLTMLVTLLVAFPLGVCTALYLQEFAPRNRWTDLIEVNINNLAAVPSIVFGLLGLAVFLNVMEMPRSAPIVGGLTLALMTLPTIIIAARLAIGAVPSSLREAALALGASPLQAAIHHVLPVAMPGVLTGAIIGMARALGETAPLLMIGMVAFIVDIPTSISDPSTVLPVQIYIWADSPERGFAEKTSAAIIVLLLFLIAMNGLAIYLRGRFERRW